MESSHHLLMLMSRYGLINQGCDVVHCRRNCSAFLRKAVALYNLQHTVAAPPNLRTISRDSSVMDQQITELVAFLKDTRPAARLMAAEGVSGLTGSPDGLQILKRYTRDLLPALFLRVPDQAAISKAALTALVNLSQVTTCAAAMVELSSAFSRSTAQPSGCVCA